VEKMMPFDEIMDVAAIITFTIVSATILFLVMNVEEKIFRRKKGWLIIALATLLFAIAAYGHLLRDSYQLQIIRRCIGIINAFLYPLGLYFIYDSYRREK